MGFTLTLYIQIGVSNYNTSPSPFIQGPPVLSDMNNECHIIRALRFPASRIKGWGYPHVSRMVSDFVFVSKQAEEALEMPCADM